MIAAGISLRQARRAREQATRRPISFDGPGRSGLPEHGPDIHQTAVVRQLLGAATDRIEALEPEAQAPTNGAPAAPRGIRPS